MVDLYTALQPLLDESAARRASLEVQDTKVETIKLAILGVPNVVCLPHAATHFQSCWAQDAAPNNL